MIIRKKLWNVSGSSVITIPKWWVRANNLEAGDAVKIEHKEDGSMVISR